MIRNISFSIGMLNMAWMRGFLHVLILLFCTLIPVAHADDSCTYAKDGECDEPNICKPGTDTTDCRAAPRSPTAASSLTAPVSP